MTFQQQIIFAVFTLLLVPIILKWMDVRFKAAAERAGPPRKSYRELVADNMMLREAMRQIAQGLDQHEEFCRDGKDEAAAATIAAMKRDIRPEWRQS